MRWRPVIVAAAAVLVGCGAGGSGVNVPPGPAGPEGGDVTATTAHPSAGDGGPRAAGDREAGGETAGTTTVVTGPARPGRTTTPAAARAPTSEPGRRPATTGTPSRTTLGQGTGRDRIVPPTIVVIGAYDPGKRAGKGGLQLEASFPPVPQAPSVPWQGRMTLTNTSSVDLSDVTVVIPADVVLAVSSKQAACGPAMAGAIECRVGLLKRGQSLELEIVARKNDPSTGTFQLWAKDPDGDLFNGTFPAPPMVKGA